MAASLNLHNARKEKEKTKSTWFKKRSSGFFLYKQILFLLVFNHCFKWASKTIKDAKSRVMQSVLITSTNTWAVDGYKSSCDEKEELL